MSNFRPLSFLTITSVNGMTHALVRWKNWMCMLSFHIWFIMEILINWFRLVMTPPTLTWAVLMYNITICENFELMTNILLLLTITSPSALRLITLSMGQMTIYWLPQQSQQKVILLKRRNKLFSFHQIPYSSQTGQSNNANQTNVSYSPNQEYSLPPNEVSLRVRDDVFNANRNRR